MSIPFVPLGPVPESGGGATAEEIIAAFKADAQLGTSPGGMVANAAQITHIGRSANPLEAGASTTETRRVVIDTREALTETRTIS